MQNALTLAAGHVLGIRHPAGQQRAKQGGAYCKQQARGGWAAVRVGLVQPARSSCGCWPAAPGCGAAIRKRGFPKPRQAEQAGRSMWAAGSSERRSGTAKQAKEGSQVHLAADVGGLGRLGRVPQVALVRHQRVVAAQGGGGRKGRQWRGVVGGRHGRGERRQAQHCQRRRRRRGRSQARGKLRLRATGGVLGRLALGPRPLAAHRSNSVSRSTSGHSGQRGWQGGEG